MFTRIFLVVLLLAGFQAQSQVKIGANPATVNPSAVLELSNNLAQAPSTWKSFIPAQVNFTNSAFTSNAVWGIAGSATEGAMVYNVGEAWSNGFAGPGIYSWQRNSWAIMQVTVRDNVRLTLNVSRAAYDAAAANTWVKVSLGEYNSLLSSVQGAARAGAPETLMAMPPADAWSTNYTVGGNAAFAKIPANNYIIAWQIRNQNSSSSVGAKLKVSTSQTTGYSDYGPALPDIGVIPTSSRTCFVLKTPNVTTASLPSFTAVFTGTTNYFVGATLGVGRGPEGYAGGDLPSISVPAFAGETHSQVICTPLRQW